MRVVMNVFSVMIRLFTWEEIELFKCGSVCEQEMEQQEDMNSYDEWELQEWKIANTGLLDKLLNFVDMIIHIRIEAVDFLQKHLTEARKPSDTWTVSICPFPVDRITDTEVHVAFEGNLYFDDYFKCLDPIKTYYEEKRNQCQAMVDGAITEEDKARAEESISLLGNSIHLFYEEKIEYRNGKYFCIHRNKFTVEMPIPDECKRLKEAFSIPMCMEEAQEQLRLIKETHDFCRSLESNIVSFFITDYYMGKVVETPAITCESDEGEAYDEEMDCSLFTRDKELVSLLF